MIRLQTQTIAIGSHHYHCCFCGSVTSPPLVFLHGFLGSGADFESIMRALSDSFYCIAVDLPGHGQTATFTDDFGMEAIAASIIVLVETLNLKPCHLLGYSMGGRLALYLGIHFPEYFRTLLLESASPGLDTEKARCDRRQQDERLAQRLEQEDFTEFLHRWYRLPLFQSLAQHPRYEAMFQRRLKNHPHSLARSLRGMGAGSQPSLWRELTELKQPTLLLIGEYDTKFIEIAQSMTDQSHKISRVMLPEAGHTLHLENESAFLKAIQDFMDTIPP